MPALYDLQPLPRHSLNPSGSSRKYHIRRLNDILHLSIERKQYSTAKRAWAILARCPEVDWMGIWNTGLVLAGVGGADGGGDWDWERKQMSKNERVEYLKILLLRHKQKREDILQELVLTYIACEKYREALDELELYLPSFPFQDNPVLHTYAGLISFYISQFSSSQTQSHSYSQSQQQGSTYNLTNVREARSYLERARILDEKNVIVLTFLDQITHIIAPQAGGASQRRLEDDDSEEGKSDDGYLDGKDDDDDKYDDDKDEEMQTALHADESRPRKRMHL